MTMLGLVAVDPALVERAREARRRLVEAHEDYAAIREHGEDCDAGRRLAASCKVHGTKLVDTLRWVVPVAEDDLRYALNALADAVLAQPGGGQ